MNEHEQINNQTIAISVKATKLTGRLLAKAMQAFLKKGRESTAGCRQSIKSLSKQGVTLDSVEVSGDNIGSFKQIARKHKIFFELKRDNSTTPPNWTVFFKAKDSKVMEAAFNEYSRVMLKQKDRKPALDAMLTKFKALIKAAPVKNRDRGGHEL
ncbi:MAG: PcfB family protein [Oscillospiraceae bacterium]|nr:PcfB family protein [Oscillospiraceae bacterium]